MTNIKPISKLMSVLMPVMLIVIAAGFSNGAAVQAQSTQTQTTSLRANSGEGAKQSNSPAMALANDSSDQYFKSIYHNFYTTYKIGPDDELAIRVLGQPDYSLDKVKVSPFGRIYHPLVGEIDVVGLTMERLNEKLTAELSQYIIDPKVTVSLLEAHSAKVGIVGEVKTPGILILSRPLTILEALNASGGVTDFGNKSEVTILRQSNDGRMSTIKVNVKRILQGKANPEENLTLQAGDTVVVGGNFKKTFSFISSLAGFGTFVRFITGN